MILTNSLMQGIRGWGRRISYELELEVPHGRKGRWISRLPQGQQRESRELSDHFRSRNDHSLCRPWVSESPTPSLSFPEHNVKQIWNREIWGNSWQFPWLRCHWEKYGIAGLFAYLNQSQAPTSENLSHPTQITQQLWDGDIRANWPMEWTFPLWKSFL